MDINTIDMTVRQQRTTFLIQPADSVWDMQQTTNVLGAMNVPMGCGGFDVDGYRIFTINMQTAKRAAGVLSLMGVEPR